MATKKKQIAAGSKHNERPVFDQLVEGLEASVAFSKGERTLRTTALPQPPPVPTPERVLKLRRKLNMSQSVFAATLNVAPKTVQAWEQGTRVPSGGAARLLEIIEKTPAVVG